MIRSFSILIVALATIGCSSTTPTQVAHSGEAASAEDQLIAQRRPYAEAFVAAMGQYEAEVQRATSLEYQSQDAALAVIQSTSPQRFDGLLDVELERRGQSRASFSAYLSRDQAFFSLLRARYHGRVNQLADEVEMVRERVVATPIVAMDDEDSDSPSAIGELARAD